MIPAPSLGKPLTAAETAALVTYAMTGNYKQAAAAVQITRHTIANHLSCAYAKLGVDGAIEAFRALGWLRVPGELVASS